ncbi:hypothetical protein [Zobellia russellii]|uniref:hypothetical protein n=1 Tax=Zobellia russellii TaxID=248907 RepID=UPI001BFF704F|nr:hypothetical protein [Zobellia russellii]MBT9187766.1 hypothetical protein [Zobellia russellii]
MRNVVYRNSDKFAIEHLLKEIGKHQLMLACENMKLSIPKRLRSFYIESNSDCTFLKYKYLEGDTAIMKIDRYQLPESGWTRVTLM